MPMNGQDDISRNLKRIFVILAFVLSIFFMRELKGILVPLVFATFLAFILNPLVDILLKRNLPNWLVMLIIFVIVTCVLFLAGTIVYMGFESFIRDFPFYLEKLIEKFQNLVDHFKIPIAEVQVYMTEKMNWVDIVDRLSLQKILTNTMGTFVDFAVKIIFTILLLMFILAERKNLGERLTSLSIHSKSQLNPKILPEIQKKIQTYISRKFLISLATGLVAMLISRIFNLEFIIMIGLLTFMLNFVPSIGSIIATIFPIVICMLQYGFGSRLLLVVILLISIQFLFGNVLEPRFMGKGLKLSPLFIVVSLFFWYWVWGPVGMIVAVPLQAIIAMILHYTNGSVTLRAIMGEVIE